jgi:hypothetical protein
MKNIVASMERREDVWKDDPGEKNEDDDDDDDDGPPDDDDDDTSMPERRASAMRTYRDNLDTYRPTTGSPSKTDPKRLPYSSYR